MSYYSIETDDGVTVWTGKTLPPDNVIQTLVNRHKSVVMFRGDERIDYFRGPHMTKRGRKKGATVAGSVSGWLKTARSGDIAWVEQLDQHVSATAGRIGVHVTTQRWIAIHPSSKAIVELTRVEILDTSERPDVGLASCDPTVTLDGQ